MRTIEVNYGVKGAKKDQSTAISRVELDSNKGTIGVVFHNNPTVKYVYSASAADIADIESTSSFGQAFWRLLAGLKFTREKA